MIETRQSKLNKTLSEGEIEEISRGYPQKSAIERTIRIATATIRRFEQSKRVFELETEQIKRASHDREHELNKQA